MQNRDCQVLVVTCNWGAYSALESAGQQRLACPPGVRLLRVPCVGRLNSGLILRAFESGADGVLLLGCLPGQCHYETGNERAKELFAETKALAHLLGLAEEQLSLDWVEANDGSALVAKIAAFVEGVTKAVGGAIPDT